MVEVVLRQLKNDLAPDTNFCSLVMLFGLYQRFIGSPGYL